MREFLYNNMVIIEAGFSLGGKAGFYLDNNTIIYLSNSEVLKLTLIN